MILNGVDQVTWLAMLKPVVSIDSTIFLGEIIFYKLFVLLSESMLMNFELIHLSIQLFSLQDPILHLDVIMARIDLFMNFILIILSTLFLLFELGNLINHLLGFLILDFASFLGIF